MEISQPTEEEIFQIAHEIESPDVRSAYLQQVCADSTAVERIAALLRAGGTDVTFLEIGPAGLLPTQLPVAVRSEKAGDKIGSYKLLQKIGEGGFGVVYLAEQFEPVRRKVALKIIKPGMDTGQVIARFEAERQALALMEHPNIAMVLDGGTTESGRPFFVMELVKGIPFTQFCDENKFSVRERLKLFSTVCKAIQHAHHKGIIHRDIKPSNVMVTLHDGIPVPKVIDFGVAKAISQQLTEKTMFTTHGQMIGTPQYMSPEQAEISGLDTDTRSDIYSLGILLYEILTGSTPLDPKKIRETAYVELQRMIREDDPERPSRRLTTQSELACSVSANRRSDPKKLMTEIHGELDWIVMKTLEKDRNRRYDSATALAEDVQRYLDGEVVEACPPSTYYRFQKFAGRNRSLLLTGSSFVAVLLMATVVISLMYDRERKTASHLTVTLVELQKSAINRTFEAAAIGNITRAKEELAKAGLDDPQPYREMIDGFADLMDGKSGEGIAHLEKARELAPNDVIIQAMLADAYLTSGNWEGYAKLPVTRVHVDAHTAYEKIFVGHALCWTDTHRSLNLLDEAIESTRAPLAYVYRARTKACIANVNKNPSLARDAMRDASASGFLPNHAIAQSTQLATQLMVHDLFDCLSKSGTGTAAEGVHAEAIEVLQLAGENANLLEALDSSEKDSLSPEALLTLGMYHQACGNVAKAQTYFERTSLGKPQVFEYAFHPDRTKAEMQHALETFKSKPLSSRQSHAFRCLLLFELERPDEANKIIDEMLVQAKDEGWVINLALVGGRLDVAKQHATRLLAAFPDDASGIRFEYLKFFAGHYDGNVDEYLSNPNIATAGARHFHVGMRLLFSGDRKNAREHLEQAKTNALPVDSIRHIASALLSRMDAPGKLDWISKE
jgi:serine/threonine protein kinase